MTCYHNDPPLQIQCPDRFTNRIVELEYPTVLDALFGQGVFVIFKKGDMFCVQEGCDSVNEILLTKEQLLLLAEEVKALAEDERGSVDSSQDGKGHYSTQLHAEVERNVSCREAVIEYLEWVVKSHGPEEPVGHVDGHGQFTILLGKAGELLEQARNHPDPFFLKSLILCRPDIDWLRCSRIE